MTLTFDTKVSIVATVLNGVVHVQRADGDSDMVANGSSGDLQNKILSIT